MKRDPGAPYRTTAALTGACFDNFTIKRCINLRRGFDRFNHADIVAFFEIITGFFQLDENNIAQLIRGVLCNSNSCDITFNDDPFMIF